VVRRSATIGNVATETDGDGKLRYGLRDEEEALTNIGEETEFRTLKLATVGAVVGELSIASLRLKFVAVAVVGTA